MKKKILSLLLAAMMVVSVTPVISATETEGIVTDEYLDGTTTGGSTTGSTTVGDDTGDTGESGGEVVVPEVPEFVVPAFDVQHANAQWKADGVKDAGEYYDIAVLPEWIDAKCGGDITQLWKTRNLDVDVAMSYDETYLYLYVNYIDPNGYHFTAADNPSFWDGDILQFSASDVGETNNFNRLEVGIGQYTDTGAKVTRNWSDWLVSGYMNSDTNTDSFGVFVDGSSVTYELRVPFAAFSVTAPAMGEQYKVAFCFNWSNEYFYNMWQLGSGISGGKAIEKHATITLADESLGTPDEPGDAEPGDDEPEVPAEPEEFTYTYRMLNDREIAIDGYTGVASGHLSIPAEIDGYTVRVIWDQAFKGASQISRVTVPDTVVHIGHEAFYGCKNLVGISIPDSVESIGNAAFYDCRKLTDIKLPRYLTAIGESLFNGCSSLSVMTVPSGVTYIGASAFSRCVSLTKISLPKGLTEIRQGVFSGCAKLAEVNIPDTMTYIGDYTFDGCKSLVTVDIPESVTEIGYAAFRDCEKLARITLPNGLEFLGEGAFYGCLSLTQVTIPASVAEFAGYVFGCCWNLSKVYFAGDAPALWGTDIFFNIAENVTLYYPEANESWTVVDGVWTDPTGVTYPAAVTPAMPAFGVKQAAAEWAADGVWTAGEYTEIDVDPEWMTAFAANQHNLDAAQDLDYTLGMSWDENYLYGYVEFYDANGHSCPCSTNPGEMWSAGCLQIAASDAGCTGEDRLEYGISQATDTEEWEFIHTVWADYLHSGYDVLDDYFVYAGNDKMVYEFRLPFSAFSVKDAEIGEEFGFALVMAWGNDGDFIHSQLGSGITGYGKAAERFVRITLEEGEGAASVPVYPRFSVRGIAPNVKWTADGEWSKGEYAEVLTYSAWLNAVAANPSNLADAEALDYRLGMSWDENYLYGYVEFEDPNGHSNPNGENPGNMWEAGCLQIGAAAASSTGANRLEYGIGLATDTGKQIHTVWVDYLRSGYSPRGDYIVTENDGTMVYEFRIPFSAFSKDTAAIGAQFGYAMVMSWGDNGDFIHSQFADGITGGSSKDAERFATIILKEPMPEEPVEAAFGVKGIAEEVEWAADGVWTNGEYAAIETNPKWMTAFANQQNLMAALGLDYEIGMSWDENYLYGCVEFYDANGHSCDYGNDPLNMWEAGCLQIGAADTECKGDNRLEYGISLATDTNALIDAVWGDYLNTGFDPAENDYIVTAKNNYMVYEFRIPFSAFSVKEARVNEQFGMALVMAWGSGSHDASAWIHTQLAAGISGEFGKAAERFAKITLEEPIVLPRQESADGFSYPVEDDAAQDTATISGYAGEASGTLEIPAQVNGMAVTTIGDGAFQNSEFDSVTIPEGVSTIGSGAFKESAVTEVVIPETVTEIGKSAFLGCENITSVTLPESVTTIGNGAFANCTSLEGEVVIPQNVTEISGSAFSNCSSLENVVVPDTVTTIGDNAFANCTSLSGELTLPANAEVIGSYAYYNCGGLTAAGADPLAPAPVSTFARFSRRSAATGILTIPAGVTTIGDSAFIGVEGIMAVHFEGDAPLEWGYKPFAENVTIYYNSDAEGWTTPQWTAPDGTVYNTVPVLAEDEEMWLLGDVNNDGEVNARDARYVLRYAVKYTDANIFPERGDVNDDGVVNARDARYILRYAVKYDDNLGIGTVQITKK